MKTIDKLLKYKFNRKERRYLQSQGYSNGCGGKGGFNFSKTIGDLIENLNRFDRDFYRQLLIDIEKLCGEHDIEFTLGGTKWDFRKANLLFAYKVFKLTSWGKWGHLLGRISLMIVLYVGLNKHGKKYFSFGKKKDIKDLFLKFNKKEIWKT